MSAVSSAASLAGGAHRDAEIRLCERRRIVHAVADHRDAPNRSSQTLHRCDLVLGQQLGVELVDADRRGDRLRRSLAVTGQHHDGLDALTAQLGDRVASCRARPIGHGDDADRRAFGRDEDRRPALRAHLVETIVNERRTQAALLEETMVAQQHVDAAHVAFGAQP